MIDLLETKRVKDLLEENPENYQAIIEDTDLAICITNSRGYFTAVNNNYCNLYHFERQELIGKSFTMVVPPENRETMQAYHDEFFISKYEILRRWKVQNKDGKLMEIFADAGYNDKIEGAPHKVTLIHFENMIEEGQTEGEFGNDVVENLI